MAISGEEVGFSQVSVMKMSSRVRNEIMSQISVACLLSECAGCGKMGEKGADGAASQLQRAVTGEEKAKHK